MRAERAREPWRAFEEAFRFGLRFGLRFAAAISRRRAAAQPGLLTWRPRAMARASAGIFLVIVEPAPIVVPAPMRSKVVGLFLLMTTLGNLVIAPQLVGIASDLLASRYRADSLRMALLPLSLVGLWAAWHFWRCSIRLKSGLIRAGNSRGLEILRQEN